MPSRNCKGIASQRTAAPASAALTTLPRSSCPLSRHCSRRHAAPTSRVCTGLFEGSQPDRCRPNLGYICPYRQHRSCPTDGAPEGEAEPPSFGGRVQPARAPTPQPSSQGTAYRPRGGLRHAPLEASLIFGPAAASKHISPPPENIPFPATPASSTRAGAGLWERAETVSLGRAGAAAAESPPSSWVFATLVSPAGNRGP